MLFVHLFFENAESQELSHRIESMYRQGVIRLCVHTLGAEKTPCASYGGGFSCLCFAFF